MDSAGNWSGTVVSWSEFFLFHVLPIAVSQIYDWLREWQILVAAVLVLGFFYLWSRTILRAARRAAKETVQSETRAFDANLKLLRRQIEQRYEPKLVEDPVPSKVVRPEAAPDSAATVEQLRQAIRLALGKIPLSDEPLSPEGMRLYRNAIDALAGSDVRALRDREAWGPIVSEVSALQQSFPPGSCREAWQSLVKVNALAREFQEPGKTRMSASHALADAMRSTP